MSLTLEPNLSEDEVDYVRKLVHTASGIALERDKDYLIHSRLLPLARRHNITTLAELLARARREGSRGTSKLALEWQIVEALTTNETSFFRDLHPFDALRTHVFPALAAARQVERTINVWCAACSTGQEPYSVAILIREHFPIFAGWRVRILATDLNREVLEQAISGRYTQLQVNRGLSAKLLVRHFHRAPSGDWQLNPEIMRMVEFSALNLNSTLWHSFAAFDLIFMRNVMIYFEDSSKRLILDRLRNALRPDGYLLLGTAETTLHLSNDFAPERFGSATFFRHKAQAVLSPQPSLYAKALQ
jgi:chemotaxis protein methyltransferase CheR